MPKQPPAHRSRDALCLSRYTGYHRRYRWSAAPHRHAEQYQFTNDGAPTLEGTGGAGRHPWPHANGGNELSNGLIPAETGVLPLPARLPADGKIIHRHCD